MNTKFTQMVQMGEISGDTYFFFEDYAYTYLKKHTEKNKLFLYGKIENEEAARKIYIYGVSLHPKLEKTYFKEYDAIGILRTNENERYWNWGKEERKIEGYFIFYSSNQAMQEYLIEQNKAEKETERGNGKDNGENTRGVRPEINIRDRLELRAFDENIHRKSGYKPVGTLLGCAGVVAMVLVGLTTVDGREKISVFKEIIKKEWENREINSEEFIEELVIEEKIMSEEMVSEEFAEGDPTPSEEIGQYELQVQEREKEVNDGVQAEEAQAVQMEEPVYFEENTEGNLQVEEAEKEEEKIKNSKEDKETETGRKEDWEKAKEYIVEEGDTLAWICKKFYGNTDRVKEIGELNNITSMDHIEPGQKLYLPN